jgi:hypothetical protein
MSRSTVERTNREHVARAPVVVATIVVVAMLAAPAAAAPHQHLLPPFHDDEVDAFPAGVLCDFGVELAVERGKLGVLFFDDGFKVLHPGLFVRVTNLDRGVSTVLNTTGTIHERSEPTADGGSITTVHITGHALLLFSPEGFVHAVGRTVITLERDHEGTLTGPPEFDLSRTRTTDVCALVNG